MEEGAIAVGGRPQCCKGAGSFMTLLGSARSYPEALALAFPSGCTFIPPTLIWPDLYWLLVSAPKVTSSEELFMPPLSLACTNVLRHSSFFKPLLKLSAYIRL